MLKTCKVDGCERTDRISFGYCSKHYQRFNTYGSPFGHADPRKITPCCIPQCEAPVARYGYCRRHLSSAYQHKEACNDSQKCSIPGCKIIIYAKGLCHKHYITPIPAHEPASKHECCVGGCLERAIHTNKSHTRYYCKFHQVRRHTRPHIKLSLPKSTSGSNCHLWKGGVARYPRQNQFIKNKKIKLRMVNNKCEICGGIATEGHHIDGGVSNHSIENIQLLCKKCHVKIHIGSKRKPTNTSLFKRLYGFKLVEIAEKMNTKIGHVYSMHRQGILGQALTSISNTYVT